MFPLITGIFLILLGSLGLDWIRRRHFIRHNMAKGGDSGAHAAMPQPTFADVLVVVASLLFIAAGLATAFV